MIINMADLFFDIKYFLDYAHISLNGRHGIFSLGVGIVFSRHTASSYKKLF